MIIQEDVLPKKQDQNSELIKVSFWDDILPRCFKREVLFGVDDKISENELVSPDTRFFSIAHHVKY